MSDILNKATVLVLNRNWQAINVRTPADAFCQMATDVATGLDIDTDAMPVEAGLRLLRQPRAPKELPVTMLIKNQHGIDDWRHFLG